MEMGMAVCCLGCDAADTPGSARCRSCISTHRSLQERIERLGNSDPVRQLASELSAMIRNPERFDHDEEHRSRLEQYQRLIGVHRGSRRKGSSEDMVDVFARQREGKRYDSSRDEEIMHAKMLTSGIEPAAAPNPSRTIPSRAINQVDRGERPGEDHELNAMVEAKEKSKMVPDELMKAFESGHSKARESVRRSREEIVDSIDELLED